MQALPPSFLERRNPFQHSENVKNKTLINFVVTFIVICRYYAVFEGR